MYHITLLKWKPQEQRKREDQETHGGDKQNRKDKSLQDQRTYREDYSGLRGLTCKSNKKSLQI